MKRNLIKGAIMTLLILAVALVAYGQTDSTDGTKPLPNKTIDSIIGDCKMGCAGGNFASSRTACEIDTIFLNGEERHLGTQSSDLFGTTTTESFQHNVIAYTSCHCPYNAVWARHFEQTENDLQYFIRWKADWVPRYSDCNFAYELKKEFGPQTGCHYDKTVADGGGDSGGGSEVGGDTPVVIDLNNDGIVRLTNKANGVQFDLNRDGVKEQLPWLADDKDGWLVTVGLDMTVHDGFYLFGNHSMQDSEIKPGEARNGYRSLRLFDDNKDGLINAEDAIYNQLGVWIDKNRNGISEYGEIVMLRDAGIESISYNYKESRRKDEHGNEFRYRSDIRFLDGRKGFSFDVILNNK